tara:strand:- start:2 stop:184 length:183 start_codon:yes stop_codon:yes gene_type:complete
MPSKKGINKTKAKILLRNANASVYKMALDKLQYGSQSVIPISFKKLETMLADINRALDKL